LTVRTAADVFLDSLDNANTLRLYGIGVGKTAKRLGEVRPLATVADDEIGGTLEQLWGEAAVNTWNARRAAVLSWLGWCAERGYDGPQVPAWVKRMPPPDSQTPARSKMAIDRLIARRDVHLREKTLWRMLYETVARSEEILGVNIEELDLAGRWSKWGDVTAKLGVLGNATQLTISQTSGGNTHIGVVADKKAYHAIRYEDGKWSDWGRISSLPTGLDEIKGMAFAGVGGDLQIVLTSPTGEIKHAIRNANGSWTAFGDLHKVLGLDEPLISLDAAAVAGEFQAAFVTADGQILHTVRHANGKWEPADDRPGIPGTPSLVALTGSLS
jgi:hypothetical protein